MVAISVYRGNLHRVPDDVPRRWRMPPPRFSLSDFRSLLNRRSAALNYHHNRSDPIPNPNPNHDSSPPKPELTEEDEKIEEGKDEVGVKDEDCEMGEGDVEVGRGGDEVMREEEEEKVLDVVVEVEVGKDGSVEVFRGEETATATATTVVAVQEPTEGMDRSDTMEETHKRKREVEEKLQLLNAKKHNLVQALKQILNAEEELQRRSTAQTIRPQLQVDVISAEGTEVDDKSITNQQSRPLLRMNSSSPSPSSDSALRRIPYFQHNMATNTPRAGMAATPSPSRFAQHGNPGQSANPPTVSIPGANYIASSPSPAASGGTPCFRDARHPSPWS
ncbi:hypothetical protein AKJ16_DCAP08303 [Drosera capensis]